MKYKFFLLSFIFVHFFAFPSVHADEKAYSDQEKELISLIEALVKEDPEKVPSVKNIKGLYYGHLKRELPDFWGIYRIGADLVQELATDSKDKNTTRVGVLDQGFDLEHGGLRNRIKDSKLPTQHPSSKPHGTHVLGTIAGNGPFGVGEKFDIQFSVRSYRNEAVANMDFASDLFHGKGYQERLIREIKSILSSNPVRLFTASLKFGRDGGFPEALKEILKKPDAIYVNAAGNSEQSLDRDYAVLSNERVLSVSSIGPEGVFSEAFSNYGQIIFLSAPGEEIFSLKGGSIRTRRPPKEMTYTSPAFGPLPLIAFRGTSMAAPHVTGTIALVLNQNPGLSSEKIRGVLMKSAIDLGPKGKDPYYGHGLVNAFGAVKLARLMKKHSLDKAVEKLKKESQKLYERGIKKLRELITTPSLKRLRETYHTIRTAYFLDPNHLARKRLLYIFERGFGFKGHAQALALELYAMTANKVYLEGLGKNEQTKKAFRILQRQLQAQKVKSLEGIDDFFTKLERALDLHRERVTVWPVTIVEDIDSTDKLTYIFARFRDETDKRKKDFLKTVISDFFRKNECSAEAWKNLQKFLDELLTKHLSLDALKLISSLFYHSKEKCGISLEDIKPLLTHTDSDIRYEASRIAKKLLSKKDYTERIVKPQLKEKMEKLKKGGKLNPGILESIYWLTKDYDPEKLLVPYREDIYALWRRQKPEEQEAVVDNTRAFFFLMRCRLPELEPIIIKRMEDADSYKRQNAQYAARFYPSKEIKDRLKNKLNKYFNTLTYDADYKKQGEVENLFYSLVTLAKQDHLPEDQIIDLTLRVMDLGVLHYKQRKPHKRGMYFVTDHYLVQLAVAAFDLEYLGVPKNVDNIRKIMKKYRSINESFAERNDEERAYRSMIGNLFGNYRRNETREYKEQLILALFDEMATDIVMLTGRIPDTYIRVLVLSALRYNSIKKKVFERLKKSEKNKLFKVHGQVWKETYRRSNGTGTFVMKSALTSPHVRSLFSIAMILDYGRAMKIYRDKARGLLSDDEFVRFVIETYNLAKDVKEKHDKIKLGPLKGELISQFSNPRVKKNKGWLAGILESMSLTNEELEKIENWYIQLFMKATTSEDIGDVYFNIKYFHRRFKRTQTIEKVKSLDTKDWAQNKIFQWRGLKGELKLQAAKKQ